MTVFFSSPFLPPVTSLVEAAIASYLGTWKSRKHMNWPSIESKYGWKQMERGCEEPF